MIAIANCASAMIDRRAEPRKETNSWLDKNWNEKGKAEEWNVFHFIDR